MLWKLVIYTHRCGRQVTLHNLAQIYAEQEAVTKPTTTTPKHYFSMMVFLSGGVVVVQNNFLSNCFFPFPEGHTCFLFCFVFLCFFFFNMVFTCTFIAAFTRTMMHRDCQTLVNTNQKKKKKQEQRNPKDDKVSRRGSSDKQKLFQSWHFSYLLMLVYPHFRCF